ncbi:MAG: ParB/RepB/Spo0J family partition protein [Deltaproteobacteria bacterium]|nr:ParB/RepB/Spo0J family partition protein [Deltaproteobacteria bacterium]
MPAHGQTGPTPPGEPDDPAGQISHLPVDRVLPNPLQPRRRFEEEKIAQLAVSIGQQGMIQPVVVRPHPAHPGSFEIVAGERRWRAAKHLGRATVPVLVRQIDDIDLLETALVENLQREALTPVEEAQAYRDLLELHGYTQETLAKRVGRDRSTIANMVRLLALPAPVRDLLEAGRLTTGHARALLALPDSERMTLLAQEVVAKDLSVRDTEKRVKQELDGPAPASSTPDKPVHHHYQTVMNDMARHLGTRVFIDQKNHQGKIEIEFYSLDDFNRLYDLLMD